MASLDNIYALVGIFGTAILFVIILLIWNTISDVGDTLWTPDTTIIRDNANTAFRQLDFMLLMGYFGLHLGILVLAFLLRTHPVIYVASILVTAILVVIAAPLANTYEDFIADSTVSEAAADMPRMNLIMYNLVQFELIWAFLTAVCLFGFARFGEGGL